MELLFESRTNLDVDGQLHFFQQCPEIHPEFVVKPDTFADGLGVTIYGSVLRDGGRYRMWYHAIPADWDMHRDMSSIAYAESDDGLVWRKPVLNLVRHGPGGNNLTNLGLHSATVFIDPDAPPERRYRATGCGYKDLFLAHPAIAEESRGYYTAYSADGLDWNLDSPAPRWRSADVITSVYHPGRRGALTAMKFTPRWMRMRRRSIHTAAYAGGTWSDPVAALYADEFDDACAATRGFHSCDYYGMGMLPAGQATVGFLWKYWHALPYTPGSQVALFGSSDIALVYQPEAGARWFHVPGRPVFIDRTRLPWPSGWINSAAGVMESGDEHRLYFSSNAMPHCFGRTEHWKTEPQWAEYRRRHGSSGISFARWPKWRLFGFEANPEGALSVNLGPIRQPVRIALNYAVARPEGFITAELACEGHAPRTLAEPLTGDSTGAVLHWSGGDVVPPSGEATLRLKLTCARVYAYDLQPV